MKLGPGEKTIVLMAAFVLLVAGLREAQPLLVPLFLAIVVAALTMPVIRWLTERRVPRVVAVLLALLLDLSVVAGLGVFLGSSLNEFYEALPRYQVRLVDLMYTHTAWLERHGLHFSAELSSRLTDVAGLMNVLASVVRELAELVGTSAFILLLAVFMIVEVGRWRVKLQQAAGDPQADLSRFDNAVHDVQKYLFVKTALNVVTGTLSGLWIAAWGVDFALLWGLLSFMLNYIPTIGSIVAAGPPLLLALVQFGPGPAFGMLIGYAVINLGIGAVVEPRMLGRALGLSPLVVLLSIIFWGWLWGPIGALLSAPLTMVVKIVLANTSDLRWVAILLGSSHWVQEMRASDWRQSLQPPTFGGVPSPVGLDAHREPTTGGLPVRAGASTTSEGAKTEDAVTVGAAVGDWRRG